MDTASVSTSLPRPRDSGMLKLSNVSPEPGPDESRGGSIHGNKYLVWFNHIDYNVQFSGWTLFQVRNVGQSEPARGWISASVITIKIVLCFSSGRALTNSRIFTEAFLSFLLSYALGEGKGSLTAEEIPTLVFFYNKDGRIWYVLESRGFKSQFR